MSSKLPAGPYPTMGTFYGSEYYRGAKQSLSMGAKIAIGVGVLAVLAIVIFMLMKNKPSSAGLYYF